MAIYKLIGYLAIPYGTQTRADKPGTIFFREPFKKSIFCAKTFFHSTKEKSFSLRQKWVLEQYAVSLLHFLFTEISHVQGPNHKYLASKLLHVTLEYTACYYVFPRHMTHCWLVFWLPSKWYCYCKQDLELSTCSLCVLCCVKIYLNNMAWHGILMINLIVCAKTVLFIWRLVLCSNTILFLAFPVLYGMLSDWWHVKAERAWWNTNPYRSMRSKSLCPLSLGSMVAAGNATSVPKMRALG